MNREGRNTCPPTPLRFGDCSGGRCQGEREEVLNNLNIRIKNLQESLREFYFFLRGLRLFAVK